MVLFRKHLLPFRPMIKFTFGPRGTSSMVWHMKFTNVTFSIIPTSASDCKVIKWMLTEPNQHLMRCLSLQKKLEFKIKRQWFEWLCLESLKILYHSFSIRRNTYSITPLLLKDYWWVLNFSIKINGKEHFVEVFSRK